MSPVDVAAMSGVLDDLVLPRSEQELEEVLDRDLIDFLVEKAILVTDTREALELRVRANGEPPAKKPFRHIVFGLTGAIASMQLAHYLFLMGRHLCQQLDVILTDSAQRIVRPELYEYLGVRVWTDAFEARGDINVPHIHLARSAEMIVVIPASAHTLFKLAHGACSDLLSLTIAATTAPVLLVPSMNPAMWAQSAIARNIETLREDGMYVVQPKRGNEVANPDDLMDQNTGLDEMGGSCGIPYTELPTILASVLAAHQGGEMD